MKNNVVEPQSGDPNKPLTASIFERKLHSLNTPKERSDANSITEKKTTTMTSHYLLKYHFKNKYIFQVKMETWFPFLDC